VTIDSEVKETLILKIKQDPSFPKLSDDTVTVDDNAELRAVKTDSAPLELPAGKNRLVVKGKCP
jgi:hypothetical protein